MSKREKTRNAWVDTLRGVAAMAVVVHHLNSYTHYTGNTFNQISFYFQEGVSVFFFLSGFCIEAATHRTAKLSEFFRHRFWRIYPPYLFSVGVVLAVCVIRKLLFGVNDAVDPYRDFLSWAAALSLTTAPASPVPTIQWVYWSLSYEVAFYFLAGLSFFWKQKRLMFYVALAAAAVVPAVSQIPGLFFLKYWPLFALGAGFWQSFSGDRRQGVLLMCISAVTAASLLPLKSCIAVLIAALLTALSMKPKSVLAKPNFFSWVGESSYSLYLLHIPIGIYLFRDLDAWLGVRVFPLNLAYYAVMLMLLIGCSHLSFRWIESPAIRMGKRSIGAGKRENLIPHPAQAAAVKTEQLEVPTAQ